MQRVTVNGNTYEVEDGASISVINGRVVINNRNAGQVASVGIDSPQLKITVEGGLLSLSVDRGDVTVNGNCGDIQCGGDVGVTGNSGKVNCGGDITCGDVGGDVKCGGDVNCYRVTGRITAGGDVNQGCT